MFIDTSAIVPKIILTKTGNKTYTLHIAYPCEKVLVKKTKDKWKNIYHPKYIIVPEGKICVWYSWPAGRNQSQDTNTGMRFKYFLLPKKIPLDKLTMNALGLLQAEMTKYKRGISNITFTNSEPIIINTVLEFFKRLDIKENDWSWSITFNFKLKEHETSEETKLREEEAERFWLKNTKISLEKRMNTFIQYTGNKKYSNMRKKTARTGTLRINHSNIILCQFMLEFLDKIKQFLVPEPIGHYLQGLFAGEASVHLTKYGSINDVNIGAMPLKEKEFYVRCLRILGITSTIESNCIRIHNLENLMKIYANDLLNLHPIRKKKFLTGLVNFKQIPKILKTDYSSIKKEVLDGRIN